MPKPAARMNDFHICPVGSHAGGPLTQPGDPTVLIGNAAAARYSDMAQCTGTAAPDAVSMGSPTVVIGKLLAGRMGESTEHGGSVVVGFPTVLIGDPPPGVTVVRRGNILIVTNRNAHTIMMVGVQEFNGDGATEAYVKGATASINKTWSVRTEFEGSPYQVDCMITGRVAGEPRNPLANQIHVV
ncbi:MAG: PAAR domain-containing protein, partial [Byssovorax sp.]